METSKTEIITRKEALAILEQLRGYFKGNDVKDIDKVIKFFSKRVVVGIATSPTLHVYSQYGEVFFMKKDDLRNPKDKYQWEKAKDLPQD